MSKEMIVRHGSPTLAELKTGNLFSCSYNGKVEILGYPCEDVKGFIENKAAYRRS